MLLIYRYNNIYICLSLTFKFSFHVQMGFDQRRNRSLRNNGPDQMPQQSKGFLSNQSGMDQALANDFNALNLASNLVKVP